MTFHDSGNYGPRCGTACPLPKHGLPEKSRRWPAAGKQWHAGCPPRIVKGHFATKLPPSTGLLGFDLDDEDGARAFGVEWFRRGKTRRASARRVHGQRGSDIRSSRGTSRPLAARACELSSNHRACEAADKHTANCTGHATASLQPCLPPENRRAPPARGSPARNQTVSSG